MLCSIIHFEKEKKKSKVSQPSHLTSFYFILVLVILPTLEPFSPVSFSDKGWRVRGDSPPLNLARNRRMVSWAQIVASKRTERKTKLTKQKSARKASLAAATCSSEECKDRGVCVSFWRGKICTITNISCTQSEY
eukprot:g48231.t1